ELFPPRGMVCNGHSRPIYDREYEWNRPRFSLHIRHTRPAIVLWASLPTGHVSNPCRAGGSCHHILLAAWNQRSDARGWKSLDRGSDTHAAPGNCATRAWCESASHAPSRAIDACSDERSHLGRREVTRTPEKTARSCDLSVSFAGIQLKNPIIAASGTFGYG